MRIGVFGRHPIPQPGFMGVMSLFEAVYMSRQGHDVDIIIPFSSDSVYKEFMARYQLADLNELEKLDSSFRIVALLAGDELKNYYDCIIYQSYEARDFDVYYRPLRNSTKMITKNFPKFVPSHKHALHETVESSFKVFDLVACALRDDVADLRMNREFWKKYGTQVTYVPRGADPHLLHPGGKLGSPPTIGLEIPFQAEASAAIDFYIEPIRQLQAEMPALRVITLGNRPHPDIKSEHVYFGRFDNIYKRFFNEVWLYLIMDYRKSPAHVSAPVQRLHPRSWSARAVYEVQNIEAQMAGAILLGHPDNIIPELVQPGSTALYIKDYGNTQHVAGQMRAALDNFTTLSIASRKWALDNFTWEHCMDLWSAAIAETLTRKMF